MQRSLFRVSALVLALGATSCTSTWRFADEHRLDRIEKRLENSERMVHELAQHMEQAGRREQHEGHERGGHEERSREMRHQIEALETRLKETQERLEGAQRRLEEMQAELERAQRRRGNTRRRGESPN